LFFNIEFRNNADIVIYFNFHPFAVLSSIGKKSDQHRGPGDSYIAENIDTKIFAQAKNLNIGQINIDSQKGLNRL